MEQREFIQQLQTGSESAFHELVRLYQKQVVSTCLGFVPVLEDAEDLAQDVFIEVFRSIHRFRGDAKLSTWIYRISVTKSLEYLRKRKRKKRFAFLQPISEDIGISPHRIAAPEGVHHPGIALEHQDRAKILFQKINSLPANQRIALILHHMEELPYKEIADVMEVSLSAVESLLFRAKKNLRKKLAGHYQNLI